MACRSPRAPLGVAWRAVPLPFTTPPPDSRSANSPIVCPGCQRPIAANNPSYHERVKRRTSRHEPATTRLHSSWTGYRAPVFLKLFTCQYLNVCSSRYIVLGTESGAVNLAVNCKDRHKLHTNAVPLLL